MKLKMVEEKQVKITWKQFKELVENAGVRDDEEIDSIDVAWGEAKDFKITHDEDFGWQITLQRI